MIKKMVNSVSFWVRERYSEKASPVFFDESMVEDGVVKVRNPIVFYSDDLYLPRLVFDFSEYDDSKYAKGVLTFLSSTVVLNGAIFRGGKKIKNSRRWILAYNGSHIELNDSIIGRYHTGWFRNYFETFSDQEIEELKVKKGLV